MYCFVGMILTVRHLYYCPLTDANIVSYMREFGIPVDFGDPLSWFRARGVYFKYMYAVAIPSKAGTQLFSGKKNSTVINLMSKTYVL